MIEHNLAAMDVVVLAGGRATRLGGLLGDLPKVLAPIGDRPYLAHLLGFLSRFGATRVVLCLGHLAEGVEAYLARHPPIGLAVATVIEPEPLGTAGAIRFARPHLRGGAVLLVNGDSFIDADLDEFVGGYRRSGAEIGLLCAEVDNAGRYGSVELDGDGFVRRFVEKDATIKRGIVSAGFAVLSPAALGRIYASRGASLERDILAAMPSRSIWAQATRGAFIDIGTPASLAAAASVILPLSQDRAPGTS
jgi:NDP-sugar pyrophosphorylase family protein